MFERLGELLKEKLESDEQDIFKDSKKKQSEEKKAENIETEPEKSSDNNTDTQEKTQENNFKFDTSKQQKTNIHNKNDSKKAEDFYNQYKAQKTEREKNYKIYKKEDLKPMPLEVQKAFDFFVLPYSASLNECKNRYKKLIKAYHPDKHSADPVKYQNATRHTAKLNEAFTKLKNWFETKN